MYLGRSFNFTLLRTKMITGLSLLRIILTIFFFAFASWFLVHALAVFGVFLTVAYLVLWFFSPKNAICFLCRTRNIGQSCPFCQRTITKKDDVAPKTFMSSILNSGIILIFTVVSISLVFVENKVLFQMGFPPST